MSLSGEISGFDSCIELKGEHSKSVCACSGVCVHIYMRTLKDICVEERRCQGIVVRESGCQGDHHQGLWTELWESTFLNVSMCT